MKAPSNSSGSGRGQGLLVTIVATTLAAAVTAGVAMNARHAGEAVSRGAGAAADSPSGLPALADGMPSDRSLPAAGEALSNASGSATEAAPTF